MKQRALYALMVVGGVVGLVDAFLQMLEKLALLRHQDTILPCELGSVFNCSNILNASQSSAFGFPNALMCVVLFTIYATIGLVGLSGVRLPRQLRLGVQGLALLTMVFGLWFLFESIYAIGSLCLLCMFCFSGLLVINATWMRLNAADLPIGERGRTWLARMIATGGDVFIWLLIAAVLAFAMLLRFYV